MRRVSTFLFIFIGAVFSVFIMNIVMYSLIPEYHDAVSAAMSTSDDIPVVTPDMVEETKISTGASDATGSISYLEAEKENSEKAVELVDEAVALAGSSSSVRTDTKEDTESKEDVKEPIVIDKKYHEDCGTGKGYWVITYSDGSVVIE